MSLNIKNPEADELAAEGSRLAGESKHEPLLFKGEDFPHTDIAPGL